MTGSAQTPPGWPFDIPDSTCRGRTAQGFQLGSKPWQRRVIRAAGLQPGRRSLALAQPGVFGAQPFPLANFHPCTLEFRTARQGNPSDAPSSNGTLIAEGLALLHEIVVASRSYSTDDQTNDRCRSTCTRV